MRSETMMWAGPLPPGVAHPSDEISEERETILWDGPLPAEGWMPPSRAAGEIPDLSRARRAEVKV